MGKVLVCHGLPRKSDRRQGADKGVFGPKKGLALEYGPMDFRTENGKTVAVFSNGEDFGEALAKLLPSLEPTINVVISAVGMFRDAELGVMIGDDYTRRVFREPMEVLALAGSINPGDDPQFHIHAVLGGHDFEAVGGHFFRATVHNTLELILLDTGIRAKRVQARGKLRVLRLGQTH